MCVCAYTSYSFNGCEYMSLGFLLGNLPKEKHSDITKEHICNGELSTSLSVCLPAALVKVVHAENLYSDL